jgi:hypothetical protein
MLFELNKKIHRKIRQRILPFFSLPAVEISLAGPLNFKAPYWSLIESFTILFSQGAGGNAEIPEDNLKAACALLGIELTTYDNLTAGMLRSARSFASVKSHVYKRLTQHSPPDATIALRAFLDFVNTAGPDFECGKISCDDYVICPWNSVIDVDDRPTFTFGQGSCLIIFLKNNGAITRMAHLPVSTVLYAPEPNPISNVLFNSDNCGEIDEILVSHFFVTRATRIIADLLNLSNTNSRILGLEKAEWEQLSYRVDNLDPINNIAASSGPRLAFGVAPYDTGAAFLPYGDFSPAEFTPIFEDGSKTQTTP